MNQIESNSIPIPLVIAFVTKLKKMTMGYITFIRLR